MSAVEVVSSNLFIADHADQNVFFAISLFFEVAFPDKNAISLHFFQPVLKTRSFINAKAKRIARIIAMLRKKPMKF